jgi:hypothetical protein
MVCDLLLALWLMLSAGAPLPPGYDGACDLCVGEGAWPTR